MEIQVLNQLFSFKLLNKTFVVEQLLKFLKLGSNPNSQMLDGNTCLHLSASNGHIE
jgi:ankyrin repeat protein